MDRLALAIRNGRLVTEEGVREPTDVGIKGGRIVALGQVPPAGEEIDASGLLVLPGCIDAHVHLTYPETSPTEPGWVDDFTSGSAAALAGGVTTVGNMCFPLPGESLLDTLRREEAVVRDLTMVDYVLHPVVRQPTAKVREDIRALSGLGYGTIKLFTVFAGFDQDLPGYLEIMATAAEAGVRTLVHCEDHAIIDHATRRLVEAGRTDLRHYAESRPVPAEVVATQRAVAMAEVTGAEVYIVHLSSKRALEVCLDARRRGVHVRVETRPLYLYFTEAQFAGPEPGRFVGQPPLRTADDTEALWAALARGDIDTVCTDHAPWSLAAKIDPKHTVAAVRPGVADLETLLPALHSEGVCSGRITLGRLVQVLSTNAARIFGLYPRKGTIRVGSDADLVLFDPKLTRTVDGRRMHSRSDYSVLDGRRLTGWPVVTIRRGDVVYHDGRIVAVPGSGRRVSLARAHRGVSPANASRN